MSKSPFSQITQLSAVRVVMSDGEFRTLKQIARLTGHTEPSVSARLRDLRKPQHGGMTVSRRSIIGRNGRTTYEYAVVGGGTLNF